MRRLRIRPFLFHSLALFLAASLLVACSQENVVPPAPGTVTASGVVLEMPLGEPLAGATVQLISNEFYIDDPDFVRSCDCEGDLCNVWTTSDAEGRWEMDVPVKYNERLAPLNMLIKVSQGTNPPQYNLFQPGGTSQGDLQLLSPVFYFLFGLDALLGGADPNDISVMLGVAIGFIDMDYPQEIATIPGVAITAEGGDPVEAFPISYLSESGLPDPGLNETSSLGVYYFSVPNANDDVAPQIYLKGTKPGSSFVDGYYPACPGSSTGVAVIDPYYQP
jgi:hypothetical protein